MIADYKKQIIILTTALDKMRRRMNLIEDRLEKIDGIKQKRPDEVPLLQARIELWRHFVCNPKD